MPTSRRVARNLLLALAVFALLTGARLRPVRPVVEPARVAPVDAHSYANGVEVALRHVALDLSVDFDRRQLRGSATLEIENRNGAEELVLDTRGLQVDRVTLDDGVPADYSFGAADAILGQPLRIGIRTSTRRVHIDYATSADASGLHWMSPVQAGQPTPYLYTQSEPIDARSWIPIHDSPQLRMTWNATIRVPSGLLAVMSAAGNPRAKSADGVYRFDMPLPVPAYLIALAVADLEFREIDARSGVYAAPEILDGAARELAVVPAMMSAAETIAGPYRWERYDLAIMPPSYHVGGMEHARLTFVSPSFISGDGSLVSLIAHELAHSWSGNLVTTATWNDPWLNEGLTVWLERRIMEAVFGREFAEMLAWNGSSSLRGYLKAVGATHEATRLHLDLQGRDPNDGFTSIAYEKGGAFLRAIEEEVGRDSLDLFMKAYFSSHAFQWMDAAGFVELVRADLVRGSPDVENALQLDAWVFGPGLPANAPDVVSERFRAVARALAAVRGGPAPSRRAPAPGGAQARRYFLRFADGPAMANRMGSLDGTFRFGSTPNISLLLRWSFWVATLRYAPSWGAMERYLMSSGSSGGLALVYGTLLRSGEQVRARETYSRARPRYHPYVQWRLDGLLNVAARTAAAPRALPPTKH